MTTKSQKVLDQINAALALAILDCENQSNGRSIDTLPAFRAVQRSVTSELVENAVKHCPALTKVDWAELTLANVKTCVKVVDYLICLGAQRLVPRHFSKYCAWMMREALANDGHVARDNDACARMMRDLSIGVGTQSTQFSSSALAGKCLGFADTGKRCAEYDLENPIMKRFAAMLDSK